MQISTTMQLKFKININKEITIIQKGVIFFLGAAVHAIVLLKKALKSRETDFHCRTLQKLNSSVMLKVFKYLLREMQCHNSFG